MRSSQKPRVNRDRAAVVECEGVYEWRVEWWRVGLSERECLRGWLRSGSERVGGSGWVFIARDGVILGLVLVRPCRPRDVEVLQGLEGLERHVESSMSLLKGSWVGRRGWVGRQAGRVCGRNRYRGCLTSNKHASEKKVSLNDQGAVLSSPRQSGLVDFLLSIAGASARQGLTEGGEGSRRLSEKHQSHCSVHQVN